MAVNGPLIATVISTAATVGGSVYAASQKPEAPKLPKLPDAPKLPETPGMAATAQKADLQAKTAGGTILSDQKKNQQQVADGSNVVRKTLLGI